MIPFPLFLAQLDASHVGVGTVSSAVTLALAEAVRFLAKKKSTKEACKAACKAVEVQTVFERHQQENSKLLMDIRDGVNKLVTLATK